MPEMLTGWHMRKEVPIALILALFLQTAGLIWWGASLSAKVEETERRVITLEHFEIARIRDEREAHARMARIDSNLDELARSLLRLDGRLDLLVQQQQDRSD